ncbi:MAG TPA: hypothetical protein VFH78_08735 [Candidatus Thermoplasmatota archaeon]|nr:hypothetical protein [Candidatus Thermoplasmatota archaeon]
MREEKIFRLGRLSIEGDLIAFEPEPERSFHAARRDAVSVGVQYAYRESSPDQEVATIRLTAHVEGQRPRTEEAVIRDNPLADDSRRGFLSVPIQVPGAGAMRGRFVVEARYGAGPWRKAAELEVEERADGEFSLVIH